MLKKIKSLAIDYDVALLIDRAQNNFRLYDLISSKLNSKFNDNVAYHNEFIVEELQKLYTHYGYLNTLKGGIEVAQVTDTAKFGIECEEFNYPCPESNFRGQIILKHP